ncbi:hypothetical protein D3C81_1711280 [compost metagenome]
MGRKRIPEDKITKDVHIRMPADLHKLLYDYLEENKQLNKSEVINNSLRHYLKVNYVEKRR